MRTRLNNYSVESCDMTDRREFLTALGAVGLTGAGLLSSACAKAAGGRRLDRIGVQLYTVRGAMERTLNEH